MSHKKRASTAFKSMGAAGLAAATVVSGLSFGMPAASAADAKLQMTNIGSAKLIYKSGNTYYGFKDDGKGRGWGWFAGDSVSGSSYATVASQVDPVDLYSNGDYIQMRVSGRRSLCLLAEDGVAQFGANSRTIFGQSTGACYSANPRANWTVTSDGKLVSAQFGEPVGVKYSSNQNPGKQVYGIGGSGYDFVNVKEVVEASKRSPLTASVSKTNNIAKSAVVSGTATPGAKVSIGDHEVEADKTTGAWSITVSGLQIGVNELTAVQTVAGTKYDEKKVTATIVEGGTLVATDAGPIALERDGETEVPFIVQNNETRSNMVGTVTLDAPKGTTFAEGQTTVAASYRSGVSGDWKTYSKLDLAGGNRSEDGKHLTFTLNTDGGNMVTGEQYRYILKVNTPENAASGSDGMDFVYAGDSTKGDFRAEGKTTTTIETVAVDLVAEVRKQDNIAKSAVIGGTATPGAKISIGDQEVQADETTGAWSITVSGLQIGANELTVVQTIDGTKHDEKKVTATIVDGGLIGPVDGPGTVLERGKDTEVNSIVRYRANAATTSGSVSFTAPEGTTFAEGQATVLGDFKAPGGAWVVGTSYARLANGTLSADKKTITFTYSYSTDTARQYVDGTELRFPIKVSTPENATAGATNLTGVYTGSTTQSGLESTFRAQATTKTTIKTAPVDLVAEVRKQNNIAKTAVIGGTATPGAEISIGDQEVQADETTGEWSITVPDLVAGPNELTVVQTIDGTKHDEKKVTATIVEGGTLVGVDQGPITLERGESTPVPFVVENRELRNATEGTVTIDAPEGTTFDGQTTVQGAWRNVGATNWSGSSSIPLTNGRLSNDDKTLTFDIDWAGDRPVNQQYRFFINVTADAEAEAGTSAMEFDFPGTSSKGDFRAQGSTSTTIENAAVPAPAPVVVISPENGSTVDVKRPVFSGTGDEGATIEVRGKSGGLVATAVVENGTWSAPADFDLTDDVYTLDVFQTPLQGTPSQTEVTFRVATNPLTTELTAVGAFDPDDVTKPATISGDATTGATVIVKDSLGNEVGRTEAKDGTYTIPVPPSFAHTGVNDFTVTQTKNDQTSLPKDVRLDYGTPQPIRITSPVNGSTVHKQGLTFTGTGDEDARIDVRGSVRAIATGTVKDGTWTAPVTVDLSNNVYNLRAVQTTKGGLTTQAPITITITDEAPVAPLTATAAFNQQDENLPATMTGTANPGATVTVKTEDGQLIGTAVAINGSYTITIPANKAHFGLNEFTVTQTVKGDVSPALERSLDYGNPAAPVITSPDNGATVTNGSIRFTGTGATGTKLDMRGNTSSIGDTTITDGTWSVDVTRQLNPNVYALHALQTSKGGLTQRANITVTITNEAPVAPLTATAAFNQQDENLPATMTGTANPGATVTVKTEDGQLVGTAVAINGSYTITIPANKAHFGLNEFTVTQTVKGDVSPALERSLDYGNPAAPVITSPDNGATVTNGSIRFTGTGATGAKLDMRGNTSSIGDTTITDGTWSVDVTRQLNPNVYALHALQTSKGGLTQRANITVVVRNEQITDLTATGDFPNEVEQEAFITGKAQDGADVLVKEGSTVIKSVKAVDSTYTVQVPATVSGERTFTVTQTVKGKESAPKTVILNYGTPAALSITSPANGGIVPGNQIVFTGTGEPEAKVVLNGTVSRLGSATVNDEGSWSITVDRTLRPQDYTLFTKQITKGNLNGPADQRTITVTQ